MEIKKNNRRDYDTQARHRRDYEGRPDGRKERRAPERNEDRTFSKDRSGDKTRGAYGRSGDKTRGAYGRSEDKTRGAYRSDDNSRGAYSRSGSQSRSGRPFVKKTRTKAVPQAPATEVRLNKFIANSGICSRREADRLILAGAVTVNGQVVTELGSKVDVRHDTVLFGGEKLRGEEKVYIIMNKPKGFVTTTSDPHAEQTVMDLLTKCPARVFPVGRLDKNTTGVLMFTNDGELSEKLTHPSFNKKKIYEVTLNNSLREEDFKKILSGINLEDGAIKADDLHYVDAEDRRKVGIEIHSGKNRIVRRIFESLGYQVKALDRVYFAGLTKKGIKRGQWRYLSEGEVNILKMGAFN